MRSGAGFHSNKGSRFKLSDSIQQFKTRDFFVPCDGAIDHPDAYLKNRFGDINTNNSDRAHVIYSRSKHRQQKYGTVCFREGRPSHFTTKLLKQRLYELYFYKHPDRGLMRFHLLPPLSGPPFFRMSEKLLLELRCNQIIQIECLRPFFLSE